MLAHDYHNFNIVKEFSEGEAIKVEAAQDKTEEEETYVQKKVESDFEETYVQKKVDSSFEEETKVTNRKVTET